MAASSVFAFWAVALLLIVVPGADWAFTLSVAIRGHPLAPAVGGLVVGYTVMTLVVAAGVGALVAGSPTALLALSAAGGLYLIWLGRRTLAKAATATTGEVPSLASAPRTASAILARGIGVSGLNPKGLLLFVALLPQFTNVHWTWPLPVQLALLGLVFTLTCAVFYTVIGLFAQTILQGHPGAARRVSLVSGVGMVLVGVGLLLEQLLH
jgi:threonine/homoserine/homoserine lactone efflux protein